jgi:Holliday junction resolvase RusA-like endonuclease
MIEFTVYGIAQPAGSKRAFVNRKSGKMMVTDANKNSRPWKTEVAAAAHTAMLSHARTQHGTLVDGPLAVTIAFVVPRPKGHFGKKGIRGSAPSYPAVRPDVLKLARGVEDACTGIVWRDDAQIVVEYLTKVYGEPARCEVTVTTVD